MIAQKKTLLTPEQEFIKEINTYLEHPLSLHGISRVTKMLLAYKEMNKVFVKEYVNKQIKVVYRNYRLPLNEVEEKERFIDKAVILKIVSDYVLIPLKDIKTKKRCTTHTMARQLCYYFLYTYTPMGTVQIGEEFDRDHSTVIVAMQRLKGLCDTDLKVANRLSTVNQLLVEYLAEQNNKP